MAAAQPPGILPKKKPPSRGASLAAAAQPGEAVPANPAPPSVPSAAPSPGAALATSGAAPSIGADHTGTRCCNGAWFCACTWC
ncbi:hypothetical protein MRX96_017731 [Rhipicephalus microplus]